MSSTTLSCCKDIDAIVLYLLTEEWAQVLMVADQVDAASKKLLQVLGSLNVFTK